MNPGFLLACSVFLIGASIICNLIFPYRILRYAILLASAGAGLLEERTSAEDDGGYPEKIKKWGGGFETNVQRLPSFCAFFLDSHRKNDTMKE